MSGYDAFDHFANSITVLLFVWTIVASVRGIVLSGDDFWQKAKLVEPEGTEQVTLRVKKSVLQTFRNTGKGYQTRMNAVLESYARTLQKLTQPGVKCLVGGGPCRRFSMTMILAIPIVLLALASTSVSAQTSNGHVNIEDNNGSSLFGTPFTPNGTPLLSRFAFELEDGDNHLKQILISPGLPPGMMQLDFSDKDPDNLPFIDFDNDDYFFNVTHFDIRDFRVRQISRGLDICSEQGKCTVQLERPAGDVVFVLIGFQLSFRSGYDHHIKEVGILEDNGLLTVAYNDRGFDLEDTFLWSLQYAYVPRDRFGEIGELSGTRDKNEVSGAIPVGRAVLRGFRFEFKPYFTNGGDHHLKKIGVLPTTAGTVLMSYRDVNGDDGFDWQYQWAILRTRISRPPVQTIEPPVVNPH